MRAACDAIRAQITELERKASGDDDKGAREVGDGSENQQSMAKGLRIRLWLSKVRVMLYRIVLVVGEVYEVMACSHLGWAGGRDLSTFWRGRHHSHHPSQNITGTIVQGGSSRVTWTLIPLLMLARAGTPAPLSWPKPGPNLAYHV